jgi:hypothetical protein
MLEEAAQHSAICIVGKPEDWTFDAQGNLHEIGS